MSVAEYRKTLGAFLTGVTVVTTFDAQGLPWGFTANSFTSVSLDPPLVLVCLGRHGKTYPTFAASERFAVSILSDCQQALALAFAGPSGPRFDDVPWTAAPGGAPVLDGALAWLDCRRHRYVEAGDHVIMIGETLRFARSDQGPLGYHDGAFVSARALTCPAVVEEAAHV